MRVFNWQGDSLKQEKDGDGATREEHAPLPDFSLVTFVREHDLHTDILGIDKSGIAQISKRSSF